MKHLYYFILFFPFVICAQNESGMQLPPMDGHVQVETNSTSTFPHIRLTEFGDDYARIKFESLNNPGAFWDLAGKADTLTMFSRLNFYFNNSLNSGSRLTITGIGDVGVGTESPNAKLDIIAPGEDRAVLRLSTERPWVFKQSRAGVNSRLTLKSTVGEKIFEIVGVHDSIKVAEFHTSGVAGWNYIDFLRQGGNMGIGAHSSVNKLLVQGDSASSASVVKVSSDYTGANTSFVGIESNIYNQVGKGVAGRFSGGYRGLRAYNYGGLYTGLSIAVEASAFGDNNTGNRIGLFGRASGGASNWAGYFAEGHVFVTNDLRIGLAAQSGAAGYKLAVAGKIIAEEVRVQLTTNWPDYVFHEEYDLMPLDELEKSIELNQHLPGIPAASVVEQEGVALGEMQRKMMEKIEELTLYIIQLKKDIQVLETELEGLK